MEQCNGSHGATQSETAVHGQVGKIGDSERQDHRQDDKTIDGSQFDTG